MNAIGASFNSYSSHLRTNSHAYLAAAVTLIVLKLSFDFFMGRGVFSGNEKGLSSSVSSSGSGGKASSLGSAVKESGYYSPVIPATNDSRNDRLVPKTVDYDEASPFSRLVSFVVRRSDDQDTGDQDEAGYIADTEEGGAFKVRASNKLFSPGPEENVNNLVQNDSPPEHKPDLTESEKMTRLLSILEDIASHKPALVPSKDVIDSPIVSGASSLVATPRSAAQVFSETKVKLTPSSGATFRWSMESSPPAPLASSIITAQNVSDPFESNGYEPSEKNNNLYPLGLLGVTLHSILPSGNDKGPGFADLEDVRLFFVELEQKKGDGQRRPYIMIEEERRDLVMESINDMVTETELNEFS
jgi:hypothetical protein